MSVHPAARIAQELARVVAFLEKEPTGTVEIQVASSGDYQIAEAYVRKLQAKYPQARFSFDEDFRPEPPTDTDMRDAEGDIREHEAREEGRI